MAWRGNISKNLKELRFLFCQTSPASSSARAFVEKNYKELKTLNPKFPILIRECSGTEPQLWARYGGWWGILGGFMFFGTPFSSLWLPLSVVGPMNLNGSKKWSHSESIDMGVERGIRLEGMTEAQISKALEDLVKVGAALKA